MKTAIVLCACLAIVSSLAIHTQRGDEQQGARDPDVYRNASELIRSKGFPVEEHAVLTADGYILTMQRIPHGRANSTKSSGPRPVVVLQHGLLDASSTWVVNFADQSLAFLLADAGYDVWLGNMRGNTYALKHVKYTTKEDAFWDFSWQDMSANDLPAMVDYALKTANQTQVIYIGHSQGTMIAFAELSRLNSALSKKIKLFIGLGPVSTVAHMKSLIRYLADVGKSSKQFVWYVTFGRRVFLPSDDIERYIANAICNLAFTDKYLCENIIFALCGPSNNLNASRVAVYTTHAPAGTSVKNVMHFAQMAISGLFGMFDYGSSDANMKHYNISTPPVYDLTQVNVPVALYAGDQDWLADPLDVDNLRKHLPNIVKDVTLTNFNHLDFVWAYNAKQKLYDDILELMQKY